MTQVERRRREAKARILHRVARAMDHLYSARDALANDQFGEQLECALVAAQGELMEAEALNDWALAPRVPRVPGRRRPPRTLGG